MHWATKGFVESFHPLKFIGYEAAPVWVGVGPVWGKVICSNVGGRFICSSVGGGWGLSLLVGSVPTKSCCSKPLGDPTLHVCCLGCYGV